MAVQFIEVTSPEFKAFMVGVIAEAKIEGAKEMRELMKNPFVPTKEAMKLAGIKGAPKWSWWWKLHNITRYKNGQEYYYNESEILAANLKNVE